MAIPIALKGWNPLHTAWNPRAKPTIILRRKSVGIVRDRPTGRGTDQLGPNAFQLREKPANGGGNGGGGKGNGGGGGGGNGDGEAGGNPGGVLALWAAYLAFLKNNPILAKQVTASFTNFIGDLLAQYFTKKPEDKFNLSRTAKFTALGFLVIGPLLHFWYGTLAKAVSWKGPTAVAAKVFLDRAFFAPFMIACVFAATLGMEGKLELPILRRKLEHDWWPTVLANWTVWIPSQAINFAVVPTNLQVLWAQSFAMFWKAYLSYRAHKKSYLDVAPAPAAAAPAAGPAKGAKAKK